MQALEVWLYGVQVGLLERYPDEAYQFSYCRSWLDDPARPLLGQIFEDRRPHSIETSGVPCWFGHLLPQPSGPLYRLLWDEAIQRGFVGDDGAPDDFLLLAMVGDDLPGGVELRPGRHRWPAPPHLSMPYAPPSHGVGLYPSLAGIQLKLSVCRDESRGFAVPVSGRGGHWIAKFDRERQSRPRVEYATTRWAAAAGLRTSDVEFAPVSDIRRLPPGVAVDGQAFVVRRFDRNESGRVHFEDFAQILDRPMPASFFRGSVEEIAAVVASISIADGYELIRRVVFAALSREWDGHLKNWAMLYPKDCVPMLTPAYDLMAGVYGSPGAESDRMVLPVGGSPRFEDLGRSSFFAVGRLLGLSEQEAGNVAEVEAQRIRDAWVSTRSTLPWEPRERETLERHMVRVPIGR